MPGPRTDKHKRTRPFIVIGERERDDTRGQEVLGVKIYTDNLDKEDKEGPFKGPLTPRFKLIGSVTLWLDLTDVYIEKGTDQTEAVREFVKEGWPDYELEDYSKKGDFDSCWIGTRPLNKKELAVSHGSVTDLLYQAIRDLLIPQEEGETKER